MNTPLCLGELQRALHRVDSVPVGPAWNRDELLGLPTPLHLREAAVLVGLVQRSGCLHVLLTRRTEGLRQHAGQVSFPGGTVDAGDADVLSAALREAEEEIGLPRARVYPLGWLDPLETTSGYRVLPVVAQLEPGFIPVPQPEEVAEVFEVDLDFLLEPAHLRQSTWKVAGKTRRILEFAEYPGAPGQRIWGVTASIMFNLRQRLERLARSGSRPIQR